MVENTLPKFAARIAELDAAIYRQRQPLPPLRLAPSDAVGPTPDTDPATWPEVPIGGLWGGYGRTVWFHGEIAIPAAWASETVVLLVRLGD